ncbi:MAG: PD-(D/E)XK nuclease family protein [Epulopiscium sp.]|nr:PD-(D/E)XK nuclease family protein [Candidatus Epulonipiscium sp.]
MDNDTKTISAGEINKFIYCPYQWYYQRVYGNKELRELVKMRNEQYGYEDASLSNFERGNRFHKKYHFVYKLKKILLLIIWIAISMLTIFVVYWVIRYEG